MIQRAASAVLFLSILSCSGGAVSDLPSGDEPDAGGVVLPSPGDAGHGEDAGVVVPEDAGFFVDAGTPHDDCAAGTSYCDSWNTRTSCESTALGTRWVTAGCPSGSGCVQGMCQPGSCADECVLGEMDGGKSCGVVDVTSGSSAALDGTQSTHDRARLYEKSIRGDGLIAGSVGNPRYADPPTYSQLVEIGGLGDSALWTGTYLAAEAFRYQATSAPDALAQIHSLVGTLHTLMNVSGSAGYLARYARPSSTTFPFSTPDLNCSDARSHCGVSYSGANWDYIGHISRDQYQGVLLGYATAYDALPASDEATREVIRNDVVTFVKELMKERTVQLQVTVNGATLPQSTANVRFIVVNPAEMQNGALVLKVNTSNSSADEMYGFQEFSPDLAMLVHEVPGLSWVPSLPRPSSAIMLMSFFQIALRVTDGVAAYQADHDSIAAYYTTHSGKGGDVNDWLSIMEQWSDGSSSCGNGYYANNITMEPMYDLARLETDATRKGRVLSVLGQKMWPVFSTTKNAFFSFIYAGVTPNPDPNAGPTAATQLSQFPSPPRVQVPVDWTSDPRYQPHDSSCSGDVDHSTAIDVGDRVVADFIWQRSPWQLSDSGDPNQTFPGVDYLVAYWMGRKHGFISDDAKGRCLVYQ